MYFGLEGAYGIYAGLSFLLQYCTCYPMALSTERSLTFTVIIAV